MSNSNKVCARAAACGKADREGGEACALGLLVLMGNAQGNNCNTVKDNMYKAFTTSSDIFYQTLNDPFPFPEKNINIKDFFRLSGLKVENLEFSENSNKLCVN